MLSHYAFGFNKNIPQLLANKVQISVKSSCPKSFNNLIVRNQIRASFLKDANRNLITEAIKVNDAYVIDSSKFTINSKIRLSDKESICDSYITEIKELNDI